MNNSVSQAIAAISILEKSQRGTGRTERIIASMVDGDTLLVHNAAMADYASPKLKARGINFAIKCTRPQNLIESIAGYRGRFVLDHHLEYLVIIDALTNASDLLESIAGIPAPQLPQIDQVQRWR